MEATGFSIWQLLAFGFFILFYSVIFGTPLKKAGFSRWWALLMAFPLLNIVAVWVFAYISWPNESST